MLQLLNRLRAPKGVPIASDVGLKPPLTAPAEEVCALRRLGYRVEDLGIEFGPSYAGQFRWVNVLRGEFLDERFYCSSEAAAWAAARADNEKVRLS